MRNTPSHMANQVTTTIPRGGLELKIDNIETPQDSLNRLAFSPAYNLTGFETVNDKVLKEMNERAKGLHSPPKTDDKDARIHESLKKYASITRSPPDTRFSAAHSREFAHQPSIQDNTPKRLSPGEVSPSKRLRNREGGSTGIQHSPTKGLAELSLEDKAKIARTKQLRQKREAQLSPKRRQQYQQQQQRRLALGPTPKLESSTPSLTQKPTPGRIEPRKLFNSPPPLNSQALTQSLNSQTTLNPQLQSLQFPSLQSSPKPASQKSGSRPLPRPLPRPQSERAHLGTNTGSNTQTKSVQTKPMQAKPTHPSLSQKLRSVSMNTIPRVEPSNMKSRVASQPANSSTSASSTIHGPRHGPRHVPTSAPAPAPAPALAPTPAPIPSNSKSNTTISSASTPSARKDIHTLPVRPPGTSSSASNTRPLPKPGTRSLSQSQSSRSVSSTLPQGVPSYARPTMAAMRRSQSTQLKPEGSKQ